MEASNLGEERASPVPPSLCMYLLSRSVISGFKVVDMVIGFFWEIIFQKMYLLNLEKAYPLQFYTRNDATDMYFDITNL